MCTEVLILFIKKDTQHYPHSLLCKPGKLISVQLQNAGNLKPYSTVIKKKKKNNLV